MYEPQIPDAEKRDRMYKDIHTIKKWVQFWSILILLPFILGVILMLMAITGAAIVS